MIVKLLITLLLWDVVLAFICLAASQRVSCLLGFRRQSLLVDLWLPCGWSVFLLRELILDQAERKWRDDILHDGCDFWYRWWGRISYWIVNLHLHLLKQQSILVFWLFFNLSFQGLLNRLFIYLVNPSQLFVKFIFWLFLLLLYFDWFLNFLRIDCNGRLSYLNFFDFFQGLPWVFRVWKTSSISHLIAILATQMHRVV